MTFRMCDRSQTEREDNEDQRLHGSLRSSNRQEVFDAINNVRGWWSGEIDGRTDKLGKPSSSTRYQDVHDTTQRITEWVPGKKVVWHVVDSHINFVKDRTEWNGTDIVFEINRKQGKTELRLRTSAWFLPSNATVTVQAHGASISTTVCAA